ncbi:MAG: ubiquinol-cytochrome c reductase iron-sulfur subunit [Magnetococcales bacterium]|nr:ubiquinol-cytochrome c reductase iron-sulfur subunit [Magnetococcales bacterium]
MAKQDSKTSNRREFLTDLTVTFGAAGAACAAYPFIKSMSPAANVKAQATTTVDISDLEEGMSKTVVLRGKPVFIKYRTPAEITDMKAVDVSELRDPQTDEERVKNEKYLVAVAVCTHLGCVPMGGGNYEGWLCPCHGSQFDASGRIRRGPAPTNLEVPPYKFLDDSTIKIG